MTYIFKHSDITFNLTNYGDETNIYFKGKEIAKFLGYKKPKKAIKDHVWPEDKITNSRVPNLGTHHKDTIFLTESGLYQLIFSSKLEMAIIFKKWVFEVVLPSIRKRAEYKLHNIKSNLIFKIESEFDLHSQVVNFIKVKFPQCLLFVANGELQNQNFNNRSISFKTGYESGTFDLIINNLHKKYNGMAIEFKSPSGKGVISQSQIDLEKKYKYNNIYTLISNDYNDIIFQIIEYMNETRIKCLYCNRKFKNGLKNHLKYFHKL